MPEVRWAILGVGRAGFARAKAIRRDRRSTLTAVHRGARAAETEAPVVATVDEAIAAADVVAICSPNACHPEQVRLALRAGRHVVVEFPLAPSAKEAESLFDLAEACGRVLHVEHIELLSGVAMILRGNVQSVAVKSVKVHFQAHASAPRPGAELALANVARLHRLIDVAGPIASVDEVNITEGTLEAKLTLRNGSPAELLFEEGPYFKRKTVLEVVDHRATWTQQNESLLRGGAPLTVFEPAPLFEQDHNWAMRRIAAGECKSYVSEGRILHVLKAVSLLEQGTPGAVVDG